MQGPTHILAGVIINRLFKWKQYKIVGLALVFIFSLLFHGIFDKLAVATYHPAHANFSDVFWVIYHVIVWLISIVLIYIFWADYKWGIMFSLLPDIDWVVVHGQQLAGIELPFYNKPLIHNALNAFLDNVPPFYFLNQLPDNRLNPWACLWEVLLVMGLILIIRFLLNYRKNIHF